MENLFSSTNIFIFTSLMENLYIPSLYINKRKRDIVYLMHNNFNFWFIDNIFLNRFFLLLWKFEFVEKRKKKYYVFDLANLPRYWKLFLCSILLKKIKNIISYAVWKETMCYNPDFNKTDTFFVVLDNTKNTEFFYSY